MTVSGDRARRRSTVATMPAPSPSMDDLSQERRLDCRSVAVVVLTPDVQVDLVRWSEWVAEMETTVGDRGRSYAREEARSYAAAILHRLVRANPALLPDHAERMAEIERRRTGGRP